MTTSRAAHFRRMEWVALFGFAFVCIGCGEKNTIPESAAQIVEARAAIEAGDTEKAVKLLDASIDADPTAWAYALRARVHSDAGNDEAANADCVAGLQLDENNEELKWIKKELSKSKGKRFQSTPAPSSK